MEEGNHISWDEYFMGIALLSALRSKDPSSKVGAAIIRDKRVLSLGYNGMPRGCDDEKMPWGKTDDNPLNTKYPYVVHAELNAILNANKDITGSTLYVTMFPCNECAKAIIQSGIKEIVYLSDKHHAEMAGQASNKMLDMAGVKIRHYDGRLPEINYPEDK
ncbi:MAG: dCMP deaminase family protein [Bacilli bacterium]|jgi:dCMP deaminase|nr:dCMP deaminase family protein [Bacilli bacterium]